MIGSVDNFDGTQNLQEWIQMVGRAAEFAGWTEEATFKAAMFRLRGEAGEHAEQLKAEGKIRSWKELQEALRDRFETAGKEQWHQYLLNTGTQGSKTVQEWAQTVRKLSLRALGSEDPEIKHEQDEEPLNAEEERAAATTRKEARRNLLDYMRKTNFVRGLRSSLRQMVWRKKCKTFDEAVRTAAEEEAVEASHREEEVLSCYARGPPEVAASGLVEKIVAALEMREDERKEKTKQEWKKEKGGATLRANKQRTSHRSAAEQSEEEYEEDEGETEKAQHKYYANNGVRPAATGRGFNERRPPYGDQLPLPRPPGMGLRQGAGREWRRAEPQNGRRQYGFDEQARRERDRALSLCFNCHQPGHQARDCFTRNQQGNDFRRLR